jgi:hypothetical protein
VGDARQPGLVSALPAPGVPKLESWRTLVPGTKLGKVEGLFPKIDDKTIAAELEALERRRRDPDGAR